MAVEDVLSIATLGGFIWAVRFLIPRAVNENDAMALACAAMTAFISLLAWLLIGVGVGTPSVGF